MVKRSSNQMAAKTAAKKAKTDPTLTSIAQVIMEAEDLPDRCRNMLIDTLPFSLMVAADQRHEIQAAVVEMVDQTLNSKRMAMEAAVATEEVKLSNLKASQGEVGSKTDGAEAAVASQKEVVQASKSKLAEQTQATNASWSTLSDQRAEQETLNAKLAVAQAEKSALASAFEEHFKPMKEGAAGPHFKGLEPHLKSIEIESSLLIALPSSCAKSKEHRGSFDLVVLEELEKAVIKKIAALAETVAAETPASAEREAVIQASEKAHDLKKAQQKLLVADFEAAQKELTDRDATLSAAKKAALELQPQIDATTELMEKERAALADFEVGTLAGFVKYQKATTVSDEAAPAGVAGA